jgi:DNA-binding CsgD family transcriptional regulator
VIQMDLLTILLVFVIILCLLAGVASLVLVWKLKKLFDVKYLTTYQFYLYFLFVFGLNGLIGSVAVQMLLENHEVNFRVTTLASHFFLFLGLPFMILAWYHYIRMCFEVVNKTMKDRSTVFFFILQALVFLIYGASLVYTSLYNPQYLQLISDGIIFYWMAVDIICRIIGIIVLFKYTIKLGLPEERANANRLGWMFMTATLIQISLLASINIHTYFAGVYMLVFFAVNIPILLYLHIYFSKNYHPSLEDSGADSLNRHFVSFGLTRREQEIVVLISKGKSNQEIADSLFISLQTVKDHNHRIYSKLGLKNRVQVINMVNGILRANTTY